MRSRKSSITSKVHKIPTLKFEDQKLTSFSGLIIFQNFFHSIDLLKSLKGCFSHLKVNPFYGNHRICLVLIVHFIMGFKRLRSRDFYFDDPLLKRFCGLNSIPDVSTISRSLSLSDQRSLELLGDLNEKIVLDRIKIEKLKTVTLDFDGFVVSTGGKVEDSAAGFNKSKKGARSYYPLGCTVAQTSQVLGLLHRSGNVHDSNQAEQFILGEGTIYQVHFIFPGKD